MFFSIQRNEQKADLFCQTFAKLRTQLIASQSCVCVNVIGGPMTDRKRFTVGQLDAAATGLSHIKTM